MSIDTLEFRELLFSCMTLTNPQPAMAKAALIAHIDTKIAEAEKASGREMLKNLGTIASFKKDKPQPDKTETCHGDWFQKG